MLICQLLSSSKNFRVIVHHSVHTHFSITAVVSILRNTLPWFLISLGYTSAFGGGGRYMQSTEHLWPAFSCAPLYPLAGAFKCVKAPMGKIVEKWLLSVVRTFIMPFLHKKREEKLKISYIACAQQSFQFWLLLQQKWICMVDFQLFPNTGLCMSSQMCYFSHTTQDWSTPFKLTWQWQCS